MPAQALTAADAPPRPKSTSYPDPYAALVAGRVKRPLGDLFGLKNFGVNLTTLQPGAASALLHRHSRQDEMIYVLEGAPTLVTDSGETQLHPGMVAGFPAAGPLHQLVNRTGRDVLYLEIGDRTANDDVTYPNDDLQILTDPAGARRYAHKDGTPYA